MQNKKLIAGLGAIFLILVALVLFNARSGFTYYYTVAEFIEQQDQLEPHAFKVAGRLLPDSVKKTANDPLTYDFFIYDEGGKLPVSFQGVLPDTLRPDGEVVVQGHWQKQVFQADSLMTKCPSKYEVKMDQTNNPQSGS